MPRLKKIPVISFVVYGAVILLLFYLALFSRGFSQSFGEVRLSGRYAPIPFLGERKLNTLAVSFQGLTLSFSRGLSVSSPQGASYSLDSVESFPTRVRLLYGNEARVSISGGDADSYTLSLEQAEGAPAAELTLVVPFTVRGATRPAGDAPILTWKQGRKSCVLTASEGSKIDIGGGRLLLSGKAGTPITVRITAAESPLDSPYTSWLSQGSYAETPEHLAQLVSGFLDAAYAGWTRGRVSPDTMQWRMPDGGLAFSEALCSALLSESIPRGTYLSTRAWMRQAMSAARLPSLSASPFTGDMAEFTRHAKESEPAEIERLKGLLQSQDLSPLGERFPVIPFILDHGSLSLVQDILSLLQNYDTSRLDGPSSLGALEALLDYRAFVAPTDSVLSKCREVIAAAILPAIQKTDRGIFLTGRGGNSADVASSIRAASLLIRAGAALTLPDLEGIGRGLLASSLELREDGEFLPAIVRLSQDRIGAKEGAVGPEDVYRYIAQDRYVPKETPLYQALGPNAWIWSAAKIQELEAGAESFRLDISFPVGIPHYILINGLKPFSRLMLHETAWRSDPAYDMYSDGWVYDDANKMLRVKLTGRKASERIEITY